MMGGAFGGGWGGGNFAGGFLMFIFWVAIIALIAWGVIAAMRSTQAPRHSSEPSALDMARSRYARGEIDKEQYDQLRKDLA